MLQRAVKSFLEKQNRLSFSSLQTTIRRLQILNISEPQVKNRSTGRTLKHNIYSKELHTAWIQSCSINNVNLKGGNKDFNKQSESRNKNTYNKTDDHDDSNILFSSTEIDNKAESGMLNCGYEKELSDIENIYDSDYDEDDPEERFHHDDKTSDNVLMPLQSRELTTKRSRQENSMIQSEGIYKPKSIIQTLLDEEMEAGNQINHETAALEMKYDLEQAEKGALKTAGVPKVEFPALTSVAPIVNDSEVLMKMVDLGVSLFKVQKRGMIDHFLKMNFKKDVAPYLFFLKDRGVPAEKFGHVITECPWIFQHEIHNLQVRVDYLRSKKFSRTEIANMIEIKPKFLLIPMKRIDAKLGYLQKDFGLTGHEIRKTVTSFPNLIVAKSSIIQDKKFYMKKFLGFTELELKKLLLTCPRLYIRGSEVTASSFDYLHNVMELSHGIIAKSGAALATPRYILEYRHRYLVKQGRAQYNPTLPNYVSLNDLVVPVDEDFCFKTAKTTISEYNTFLRLI